MPTSSSNNADRIMAFGESYVDIREEIYSEKVFPLAIKYTQIENLAAFIRDKYTPLEGQLGFVDERWFLISTLRGYLVQKYGSEWFTDDELAEGIPMLFDFAGSECEAELGAYYACELYLISRFYGNPRSNHFRD